MSMDSTRTALRRRSLHGLLPVIILFASPAEVYSEAASAGDRLARFVCQARDAANETFLDRVLVLDQTSTKPLNADSAQYDTIDGTVLIDGDHETSFTDDAAFRMRIFNGVSLISNLSEVAGRATEQRHMGQGAGDDESAVEKDVLHYRQVRQTSLAMGITDDELIAELGRRQGDHVAGGQRMDYTGVGARAGRRFGFQSTGTHGFIKSMDIFLGTSRGRLDTILGAPNASEDGPYVCKEPVLFLKATSGLVGCDEVNDDPVDMFAVANDPGLVRGIQRALADRGVNPGPIDGILGPRTVAALGAWKESRAYVPAEILTRAQLCALLAESAE